MIEPKRITIKNSDGNDMVFNMQPLPALDAGFLDKEIMSLLIPALGGIENLDAKFNFEIASKAMSIALRKLSKQEYSQLISELLRTTQHIAQEKEVKSLTLDDINNLFLGNLKGLYKLIYEVMKFNKFTPFEMVEGGSLIQKIRGSIKQKPKTKKNLSK
jgi:hypothetical protein